MTDDEPNSPRRMARWPWAWAGLVWAAAWLLMLGLDRHIGLAQAAITLVLASALAAIWLPLVSSLLTTTAAVLAFDWFIVPPKHSFSIELSEDVLLVIEILVLSWVVTALLARGRVLAARARRSARHADQMRRLGDALRDAEDPLQRGEALRAALSDLLGQPARLLVLRNAAALPENDAASTTLGDPAPDELVGLWHCVRLCRAFGPGTGHEPELPALYLPLRGTDTEAFGAALIPLEANAPHEDDVLVQAQALCDQLGQLLHRARTQRQAESAHALAQSQAVRNALLAAISHDYRTPLAAILGAASSLKDQGAKLAPEQRERLTQSIMAETRQLSRLTDNTLQLVRLDAPGVKLNLDWESPDELAGAAIERARRHDPERRLKVWAEPGLPLVRCDAVLFSQMLENLIDNALKYSDAPAPVELHVRRHGGHIVFAVRDSGPGVEPAWREKIFDVFQRGDWRTGTHNSAAQRGAGVGLAVCRAIARAHGGELQLRPRSQGGSSFECWLREEAAPGVDDRVPAPGGQERP
ncbi:MAG TPA: ATP-binding protein [Burkholderiaceae bacterium]|nr:ATP-binding protein [Burkholderiaceae bacterium]